MALPDTHIPGAPAPEAPAVQIPEQRRGLFTASPLNQRRWRNFKRNRRAFWSLIIFSILFGMTLFAEYLANDRPILVNYQGELYWPIHNFYSEQQFGGDFPTEAVYRDIEVQCLIISGGVLTCFDDPEGVIQAVEEGATEIDGDPVTQGWMLWPLIPYSYNTPNTLGQPAPSPPDANHWLGTDDA
ncbi:MAG: ABC transporter permease, partial [Pseudomonadota bacterium]